MKTTKQKFTEILEMDKKHQHICELEDHRKNNAIGIGEF